MIRVLQHALDVKLSENSDPLEMESNDDEQPPIKVEYIGIDDEHGNAAIEQNNGGIRHDEREDDSGIDDDRTAVKIRPSDEIEEDDDDDDDGDAARPGNARPEWFPLVTFTTMDDYLDYIKKECFSTHKTVTTKKVVNRYLRCKLVRKYGPQCHARLCLRMNKDEVAWRVFTNGLEHTHQLINNKKKPKK